MKMEQTECSETSAYKIQIHTPGNYPEESIRHSEHGASLKSRIKWACRKTGIKNEMFYKKERLCFYERLHYYLAIHSLVFISIQPLGRF